MSEGGVILPVTCQQQHKACNVCAASAVMMILPVTCQQQHKACNVCAALTATQEHKSTRAQEHKRALPVQPTPSGGEGGTNQGQLHHHAPLKNLLLTYIGDDTLVKVP
jgi:hypothetical protein